MLVVGSRLDEIRQAGGKKELRYIGELTDVVECDVGISCHPGELRVAMFLPIAPELVVVGEIMTEVRHELVVRPHPLFSTLLEWQQILMHSLPYIHPAPLTFSPPALTPSNTCPASCTPPSPSQSKSRQAYPKS